VSGQTFGHRYGLVFNTDNTTSLNMPQLVEMYANFGMVGVVFGMMALGLLYRLLMELFIHPEMGFGALIGGVYFVAYAVEIGSATSLSVGAIPWVILFMVAISFAVKFLAMDLRALDSATVRI
jgi:hypothetical protein